MGYRTIKGDTTLNSSKLSKSMIGSQCNMNYGLIKYGDDVNVTECQLRYFLVGVKLVVWGFNKEAQDERNYGQPFTEETKQEIFNYFTNNFKYIDNLCIIGGHMYEDY